ncbi:multidrug efflux transporter AcrB transmembrane domain-containing protein [Vararia minispora EC-137]|uniref:Multidrug efflux transporter AcrB transmembrane domain-containing protein n=1 Tax=Vararia minispora EC-137 TaxID=1314806 RepID=A0ACB8QNP3_9AGAM|nr:multidrug efflux transporter AcrB transmembrane domain-containing protein [Vararia minispora EC-137]
MAGSSPHTPSLEGKCAMRGSCGSKDLFGKPLPCPYDGPPVEPDESTRSVLGTVCGDAFMQGPACCNLDQLEVLNNNLATVELIISACPACRNNFREFFCHLTCSPNQSDFVNVTSTQTTSTGETAVKSLDLFVSETLASGFYDSCRNVQFGSSNQYAMELIGGGAKNYQQFLAFLGDEKPMGSPFQIDFPLSGTDEILPLDLRPRHCTDNDISSRCACIDCPDVCPSLPLPPDSSDTCHIGAITCLSFFLILAYGLCFVSFMTGYGLQSLARRRRYERLATAETASDTPLSPTSRHRTLVGASSLARDSTGDQSVINSWDPRPSARGVSLLDPVESVQPRQYRLNDVLRRWFYRTGLFIASRPLMTLATFITLVGLLNIGWKDFTVERDPVKLWVAPNSESRLQKQYFDEHFGPFFRPQQIFVTSVPRTSSDLIPIRDSDPTTAPVLTWEHLQYWFQVESDIRSLRSSPNNYTLDDVCFKPLGPDGACVVQSITAWFGNDIESTTPEEWSERLVTCANRPVECLPDFMQPLGPQYVLGSVPNGTDYLNAEALVVTIIISDSLDPMVQAKATEWERTLRSYLADLSERAPEQAGLRLSFSTGVSLEEELNKSTNMDVKIVILSYLAMFFYVSLTLGSGFGSRGEESTFTSLSIWASNLPKIFNKPTLSESTTSLETYDTPHLIPHFPRRLFIGSRFTLGLFGILLVILSVSASVGFFSTVGVKVTLIIAEVIPFLVLAVGVDNVFILVNELDRQNMLHGPNAATPDPTGSFPPLTSPTRRQLDSVIDESIDAASVPVLLSPEERVARTVARMGPSILLSSITETLAFLLGALVPMPAVRNFALYAAGSVFLNAVLQMTVFVAALVLDIRRIESNRTDCFPCIRLPSRIQLPEDSHAPSPGILARVIRKYYAPFILRPFVKGVIILFFGGVFIASVISIQHIKLGLDQRLALPSESYLVEWFNDMDSYLDIGPPVYFVSQNVNVTARKGQQHLCARFTTCDELSIANLLEVERKRTNVSYLSQPSASWIDDFLRWLNPDFEECCRVLKRDPSKFCTSRDRPRNCQPCFAGREPAWNTTMQGFPEGDEFIRYLKHWLASPPSEDCPLSGAASYGDALALDGTDVTASHFRTFFEPLKSQDDFINAFTAAHRIADELSETTGAPVFPYSLFFVFFDQYAHIIAITQEVLGLGLAAVLLVTALFLGAWRTGAIVTGVVALTVVNVMGFMALWGISLNALSLVNLVISLGIAVEFCAHVARAFMTSGSGDHPTGQRERDERMWAALADVGPSVLSGITFTKLIGMCVLALTRSKLLEIYYFRMWITLIVSGALHGLVLLPVVLSLAGGPGFPMQEADEEWMSNALRSDYEYTPFLADDASYYSD